MAILALSQRFCRTSHEVLLDNALTAAISFTILFTWIALETDIPRKKRLAYAAAGFSLGISFLFKGFVGVTIFGSGFFLYLVMSRRFDELRHIFRPLPIIAFFLPVLSWTVPFLLYAQPDLIREFFINNNFGRFLYGYKSNHRPFYFYIKDIWVDFAPGGVILPFAIWMAWKSRQEWENRAGIFSLCLFIGPLVVLSASVAKDNVYLLPVHPALAMLVAWSTVKGWSSPGRNSRILTEGMAMIAILATGIIVGITGFLANTVLSLVVATIILVLAATKIIFSIRRGDLQWSTACIAVLFALVWSLWFTGPLAEADMAKSSTRQPMMNALRLVGDRDLVIYDTDDGVRGAAGFYRNRSVQEIQSVAGLIIKLGRNPGKTAALTFCNNKDTLPPEIQKAAQNFSTNLHIEAHFNFGEKCLLLISAYPKGLRGKEDNQIKVQKRS